MRNLAPDPAHTGLIAELTASLLPETSVPAHRGIMSGQPNPAKKVKREKQRQPTPPPSAASPEAPTPEANGLRRPAGSLN